MNGYVITVSYLPASEPVKNGNFTQLFKTEEIAKLKEAGLAYRELMAKFPEPHWKVEIIHWTEVPSMVYGLASK